MRFRPSFRLRLKRPVGVEEGAFQGRQVCARQGMNAFDAFEGVVEILPPNAEGAGLHSVDLRLNSEMMLNRRCPRLGVFDLGRDEEDGA